MTDDELNAIEERTARAKRAKNRLAHLTNAKRNLADGDVTVLEVPMLPGHTLRFQNKDHRSAEVCWARQEVGLWEELAAAIGQVLDRRIAEAEEAFAEV